MEHVSSELVHHVPRVAEVFRELAWKWLDAEANDAPITPRGDDERRALLAWQLRCLPSML